MPIRPATSVHNQLVQATRGGLGCPSSLYRLQSDRVPATPCNAFEALPAAATFRTALGMNRGAIIMQAIVVTDRAAGTAGMTLVDRPAPQAAINDVVVQVYASGFVPTELT